MSNETVWNDADHAEHLAQATWMANTAVLMHLNERATGDPARNWLTSWAHRYFAGQRLRVLVLGCGEGWLERGLAEWSFVQRIDAVDFAAEAVRRAAAAAKGIEKITYGVVDLNRDELPARTYDVVVAHSVLHHVENLEHAYAQIERSMRPDATLIVNEYAGPDRFQFNDDVLAIMNRLRTCLGYAPRPRPTVQEMIANDPTEAVRSSELVAMTARHFDLLEQKNLGGTLLQHLLYEIAQDFRFDDPVGRSLVEMLCTLEAWLVDSGRIPCDYVLLAARKRGSQVRAVPRPLPLRPLAANDVEKDPLRLLGVSAVGIAGGSGRGDRRGEWPFALRCLRLAILAAQPSRATLYRESPLLSWRERLLARGTNPWNWIEQRAPRENEVVTCLLRTAATLAAE